MLSALDFATIKINQLEKENERKEIRLAALRCRLKELIENPLKIIIRENV